MNTEETLKIYSPGLPVHPSISQVERACDHTAGREREGGGSAVGGTEVKIKQTIRVSTAASHSKHTSSEAGQIEIHYLSLAACTSDEQLPALTRLKL